MKEFTLTYADGGKCGGKYTDEADAREVAALINPSREIASVEQRPLFTSEEYEEMDREKAWHRSH